MSIIITKHELNIKESRNLYAVCDGAIQPKQCYNNVFNAITLSGKGEKFATGEWKIAYGYVSSVQNLMARHAFIVDEDGKAIDPTLISSRHFTEDQPNEYISFKIMNLSEYLDALGQNDNQPALFRVFNKEEQLAHKWSQENNRVLGG